MIKRIFKKLLPSAYVDQIKNFSILATDYGQFRSIKERACIYFDGSCIPWYTYPAIEYLRNLDFTDKTVFEYGSGNSTLFWADRVKRIVSVEDNADWFNKINLKRKSNSELLLRPSKHEYIHAIHEKNDIYDIVITDGNHRPECARQLEGRVHDNGMVMLDNSDWFKNTARFIREAFDFIEVDFHGFGTVNGYTWTTSLFISRNARYNSLQALQPNDAIGGLNMNMADDVDY
jgi:hypothetical protein